MGINERLDLIRERLIEAFEPIDLTILDESDQHVGHAGAEESGGGHFNVYIVSQAFEDKSAIERHRLIYVALGDAMATEIHALSIEAKTPEETRPSSESPPSPLPATPSEDMEDPSSSDTFMPNEH